MPSSDRGGLSALVASRTLDRSVTDEVPLREFLERRIDDLERRLDERDTHRQEALRLQHVEYERRLDTLNHAHEQAVEVQHTYVTQDKYEDKQLADSQARDLALKAISDRVAAVESEQSNQRGRAAAYAAAVVLVLTLAGILVRFL